ncbi:SMI1/KNR4 family protein [Chryseobacterium indologenes]|uniref:SMI1/KNR4 family protein n=1 Tax=Chryseobacterium indologenes TaxID=253 RepID=UPI0040590622
MTIEYLKKLKENPTIHGRTIKGVSEVEIAKAETKFNIKFPKAYKEFLFLAGESRGLLPIMGTTDLETISSDWHHEIMQEELDETTLNKQLIRPFWLFAESNECEVFYFFYLDENTEDPKVYLVNYGNQDRTKVIEPLNDPFSIL